MGIHKRLEFVASPSGDAWLTFERIAGREFPFAVDVVNGSKEDHLDWLDELGVEHATYSAHGFCTFFDSEHVAIMFYLRWGTIGS